MVKKLPAMQETQVQFLGQENPLEKGMGGRNMKEMILKKNSKCSSP